MKHLVKYKLFESKESSYTMARISDVLCDIFDEYGITQGGHVNVFGREHTGDYYIFNDYMFRVYIDKQWPNDDLSGWEKSYRVYKDILSMKDRIESIIGVKVEIHERKLDTRCTINIIPHFGMSDIVSQYESIDNDVELRQTLQDIALDIKDEGYDVQISKRTLNPSLFNKFGKIVHQGSASKLAECILVTIRNEYNVQDIDIHLTNRPHMFYNISDITGTLERMTEFMESEGFYYDFVIDTEGLCKVLSSIKDKNVEELSIRFFKRIPQI